MTIKGFFMLVMLGTMFMFAANGFVGGLATSFGTNISGFDTSYYTNISSITNSSNNEVNNIGTGSANTINLLSWSGFPTVIKLFTQLGGMVNGMADSILIKLGGLVPSYVITGVELIVTIFLLIALIALITGRFKV